jgi:predicted amidohydrolase YtcJ
MKAISLRLAFPSLLFLFGTASLATAQGLLVQPADSIVLHGRVYTENPKQPWAQAVAIRGGKIVAVGDDNDIEKMRGMGTKVINAGGKLVLPGFVDSHIHFFEGSIFLNRLHLEGTKSLAEIQQRLREYGAKHPGDGWLVGAGWDYAAFGEVKLPHKKYLDELFPDRPVFLDGFDGHTAWVNSKALALAGIGQETLNPPNGVIERDSQTGEATGVLKEDDAIDLIKKVRPKPERAERLAALRAGMRLANQNGLTRVHAAGGHFESGDFDELDLYDELLRRRDLSVRLYVAYFVNPPELRSQDLDTIEAARKKYSGDWLEAGVAKLRIDGVIESHTAAMLEPYSDDPSTKGTLFWNPDSYKAAVAALDKRGLQIFTHAIGDYAVRTALDAYEEAAKANHTSDRRHRVEHIETISASDIPRFGTLGVIASMQPLHAYPDEDTLNVWLKSAGPDRASRAWPWHSIAAAGGRLAFGSDWNVVTLNPFDGLQNAVTRQTADGKPAGGWIPQERITLAQAVEAYTLGAALAGHREKWEGSLEPEKLADLIIVSQNIFEIDPHKIKDTKVALTMVGGRVVYRAEKK